MNTLDLFKFIINDSQIRNLFYGIFARDELPKNISKSPSFFILNTEKRSDPGAHWLLIYIDKNRIVEFFDPYGHHPKYYKLENYLNQISNSWNYNKQRIQSLYSFSCGQICLFYIFFKSRGFSLTFIQKVFSTNYEKNEKIIFDFFKFKFI